MLTILLSRVMFVCLTTSPLNAQSGSMSRFVLGKPAHTVTFRQSDTATPFLPPVSEEPHFSCPYPPGVQQNMAELVSTPQLFNHPGVSTESCMTGRNARACYGQGLNMTTSPSLHVNLHTRRIRTRKMVFCMCCLWHNWIIFHSGHMTFHSGSRDFSLGITWLFTRDLVLENGLAGNFLVTLQSR